MFDWLVARLYLWKFTVACALSEVFRKLAAHTGESVCDLEEIND